MALSAPFYSQNSNCSHFFCPNCPIQFITLSKSSVSNVLSTDTIYEHVVRIFWAPLYGLYNLVLGVKLFDRDLIFLWRIKICVFLLFFRWDHGQFPQIRSVGGRLASQSREQVLFPAKGIRFPLISGNNLKQTAWIHSTFCRSFWPLLFRIKGFSVKSWNPIVSTFVYTKSILLLVLFLQVSRSANVSS